MSVLIKWKHSETDWRDSFLLLLSVVTETRRSLLLRDNMLQVWKQRCLKALDSSNHLFQGPVPPKAANSLIKAALHTVCKKATAHLKKQLLFLRGEAATLHQMCL